MHIHELKKEHSILSATIETLIKDFETQTETTVSSIRLNRTDISIVSEPFKFTNLDSITIDVVVL